MHLSPLITILEAVLTRPTPRKRPAAMKFACDVCGEDKPVKGQRAIFIRHKIVGRACEGCRRKMSVEEMRSIITGGVQ
jgi:hypothetical protein